MSLKQKISNIIQCRIDIAEQDKEIAIRNELMVLKRELLETLDEAMQELDERAFRYHNNSSRLVKFCDVKAVLGQQEGENKK
jgi:hypothetical protein